MTPPDGWTAVKAVYGDPDKLVRPDGTVSPFWEARMVVVDFPSPLPIGWDPARVAHGARVNTAIAEQVERVFERISEEGLWGKLRTFDGGYAWRAQRNSSSILSLHSYGAALDFNAATNKQGMRGDMDPSLVRVFGESGWTWGGSFQGSRIDPMHFQFAKGC